MTGNRIEIGDVGESPRKSSLFFFTARIDLGIGLTGDKVNCLGKRCIFCIVWCAFDSP